MTENPKCQARLPGWDDRPCRRPAVVAYDVDPDGLYASAPEHLRRAFHCSRHERSRAPEGYIKRAIG